MNTIAEAVDDAAHHARLLARTPMFKSIAPEHLRHLTERAAARAMHAGDVLFRRGDPGSSMLVILAGQVRIALPGHEGREQVLRILQPGEVLGELALLDGRSRTADAVAETNGRLLHVERRDMLDAMRSNPDLALAVLTMLTERLRATNWLLESMLFYDAGGRLAATLLMLAQGRPGGRVDITQGALGERIGAARETVNRRLRDWQAEGILALEPGRIIVKDVAALRRHAPPSDLDNGAIPQIW